MKDGMAMLRQLGKPTFFLTLSAAESNWKPLLLSLYKVANPKDADNAEAKVNEMTVEDKAELIRNDPVTCAEYFSHRSGKTMAFLKTDGSPLAPYKVVDSIVRVEFQHRGSPHIHCLLWVKNCEATGDEEAESPQYRPYDPVSEAECVAFIDKYMTCSGTAVPQSLLKVQKHKHTFSCKRVKKKEASCRFGFPHFPMEETRILDPFEEEEVTNITAEKKNLSTIINRLQELWKQIRKEPVTISFAEFLQSMKLTKEEYINAIRRSLNGSKVFLARSPSEIDINAYNPKLLELHQANMDIQFVLDPYACVSYILSYINKANRGMSKLMREIVAELNNSDKAITHREKLKIIASKFLHASEISAQEAVYYILQMPVSMSSRHVSVLFIYYFLSNIFILFYYFIQVQFINTSPPDKRVRMVVPESVLRTLPQDSEDVFSSNLLDYYSARPEKMKHLSLAEVVADYNFVKGKSTKGKGKKKVTFDEADDSDEDDLLDANAENFVVDPVGDTEFYDDKDEANLRELTTTITRIIEHDSEMAADVFTQTLLEAQDAMIIGDEDIEAFERAHLKEFLQNAQKDSELFALMRLFQADEANEVIVAEVLELTEKGILCLSENEITEEGIGSAEIDAANERRRMVCLRFVEDLKEIIWEDRLKEFEVAEEARNQKKADLIRSVNILSNAQIQAEIDRMENEDDEDDDELMAAADNKLEALRNVLRERQARNIDVVGNEAENAMIIDDDDDEEDDEDEHVRDNEAEIAMIINNEDDNKGGANDYTEADLRNFLREDENDAEVMADLRNLLVENASEDEIALEIMKLVENGHIVDDEGIEEEVASSSKVSSNLEDANAKKDLQRKMHYKKFASNLKSIFLHDNRSAEEDDATIIDDDAEEDATIIDDPYNEGGGSIEEMIDAGCEIASDAANVDENVCAQVAVVSDDYVVFNKNGEVWGKYNPRLRPRVIRFPHFPEYKDRQLYLRARLVLFGTWETEPLVEDPLEDMYMAQEAKILEVYRRFVPGDNEEELLEAQQEREKEDADDPEDDQVVDPEMELYDNEHAILNMLEAQQEVAISQQIGMAAAREPPQPKQQQHEAYKMPHTLEEIAYKEKIAKLNAGQMKIFLEVVSRIKQGDTFHLLVTGGAGTGKSFLINVLYNAALRYYNSLPNVEVDQLKVLLCAPTGKAAFNIHGMTLHRAFSLPVSQCRGKMPNLSADVLSTVRSHLRGLKLLILDEISMIGLKMIHNVDERLKQIMGNNKLFGGIPVIAFGDFNQLQPVGDR